MRGTSNIISSVHHLRIAFDNWESFQREHPGSKGAILFEQYKQRALWIFRDMITNHQLPVAVREGIKAEWNSDVYSVDAIAEKAALLNPEQRETLELIIETLLKGETIQVEHV